MRSQTCTLPDGATTVVEWFDAAVAPAAGRIVFVPALGVQVAYYRGLCEAWAQRGWQVAAIELRGMRQSSVQDVKRHNFGYREVVAHDLPWLAAEVARAAGPGPLVFAGHSLGGQFALMAASRVAQPPAGIVLIAGGSNHYRALATPWARRRRWLGLHAVRATARALGWFPGDKIGFGGRQPLNMMLDWTCEALTGRYAALGDGNSKDDLNAALEALALPVLMVSLTGDRLVPRSSADALAAKLKRAAVTQLDLQAHDHFKWVRQPEMVLEPVHDWMAALAGPASPAQPKR
jgi:predicted alpha/beta hydrolase